MKTIVFTAPPGGVLLSRVGAVTGEVELRKQGDQVMARYHGSRDRWRPVAGRPPALFRNDLPALADILSQDPGTDRDGNPIPARF